MRHYGSKLGLGPFRQEVAKDSVLGDYLRQLEGESFTPLSGERELALAKSIRRHSKKARDAFITANLRLVVDIVKGYAGLGVPAIDLIQAGNTGLIVAVDKFDWHKGLAFSTMASKWIRSYVVKAIPKERNATPLPYDAFTQQNRIRRALKKGATLADLPGAANVTQRQAANIMAAQAPLSLELATHDNWPIRDTLPDPSPYAPGLALERLETQNSIFALLSHLTPLEARIIIMRYGLAGNEPCTYAAIAQSIGGYTAERIRQIEKAALIALQPFAIRERLITG